ncbi:Transcription factor IIB [Plasmopara halstedii]|uniref:Transcription factor IIB n=1 Tax=Plasmopara halstedii TaxID=4781 RepID=A0A0P1ANN9_PLAHL|nr:Transcription factor IIB [Plasmopara halstedii]CEG42655.1 Transcription factor IIB [Plasmopara halstedii]|eukprot:XP_024579024.1 Transcription factor IIB [Plasmopara halstedii]
MPVWQEPFVEVIKYGMTHNNVGWHTQGHVEQTQDKHIHQNIFKIRGAIAATNFLRVPRDISKGTHGLGLTGRYVYLQVRRIKNLPMTIHLDFVTSKKTPLRFTLSSIYELFRGTGTVLRVPLSLDTRWTVVVVDMVRLLERHSYTQHARDTYRHLKAVTLCASMNLRNFFVSATLFTTETLPSSLQFASDSKHPNCWIIIPSDDVDGVNHQFLDLTKQEDLRIAASPTLDPKRQSLNKSTKFIHSNTRIVKCLPSYDAPSATSDVLFNTFDIQSKKDPFSSNTVMPVNQEMVENPDLIDFAYRAFYSPKCTQQEACTQLISSPTKADKSDPILKLERIIGFSNDYFRMLLWVPDGSAYVYANNSTIVYREFSDEKNVSMETFDSAKGSNIIDNLASTTRESFMYGHNSAVCALAITSDGRFLASAELPSQTKQNAVRLWNLTSRECITVVQAQSKGVDVLCFSPRSKDLLMLCIVGRDECFRTQILIWNCLNLLGSTPSVVQLLARQTSDFPINRIAFSPYEQQDHYHLISCGRENIRYWRVNSKSGHLTGSPVILNEYSRGIEFTDIGFDPLFETHPSNIHPVRPLYVSSSLGTLLVINYDSKDILCVYQLHDAKINCLSINEGFCVTGSDDCFLRVWPLDFSDFFLEAQHEAGIKCIDVSVDGIKVLVGSRNNAIGVLDISSQEYTTLLRCHTKKITAMTTTPWKSPPASLLHEDAKLSTSKSELVTASEDGTLRVWDTSSGQQLYEFYFEQESVTSLAASPLNCGIVAVGFDSGFTRIFDVHQVSETGTTESQSSFVHELKQHQSAIRHIAFDVSAHHLFNSGEGRQLCLYDAKDQEYVPLKMVLADFDPEDGHFEVSHNGKWLAFISSDHREIVMLNPYSLRVISKIQPPKQRQEDTLKVARFNVNSSELLVLSMRDRLHIFSLPERQWVQSLSLCGQNGISSFLMSFNEKYMISGGMDGSIRVWDWDDKRRRGRIHQSFFGHTGRVNNLAITRDGQSLVATGNLNAISIWRVCVNSFIFKETTKGYKEQTLAVSDENSSKKANSQARPTEISNFRLGLKAFQLNFEGLEITQRGEVTCLSSDSTNVQEVECPTTVVNTTTSFVGDLVLSQTICGFCSSNFAWSYSMGKLLMTTGSMLVVENIATGKQEFYDDASQPEMDESNEIALLQLSPDGAYVATISSRFDYVIIRSIAGNREVKTSSHEDIIAQCDSEKIRINLLPYTRVVTCLAFAQNFNQKRIDKVVCMACEVEQSQTGVVIASLRQRSIIWSSISAGGTQLPRIRQIIATSDSQFLLLSTELSSISTVKVYQNEIEDDSNIAIEAVIEPLINAFPTQVQLFSLFSKEGQSDQLRYLVGIDNDRYCYFYDLQHRSFVATTQLLIPIKFKSSNNQVNDQKGVSSFLVEVMEWVTTAEKSLIITGSTSESVLFVHALPMLSTKYSTRIQIDWQRLARAGVSLMCQISLPDGGLLRGLSVDPARDVGIATTNYGTAILIHFEACPTTKVLRETARGNIKHSQPFVAIRNASWALDGTVILLTSENDNAIRVWLPEIAREIAAFKTDSATCTCFAVNPFSTNGVPQSMVMAGYSDGSLRVFDLCDMRLLSKFELSLSQVKSARIEGAIFVRIVFVGSFSALIVTHDSRVMLVNIANALLESEEAQVCDTQARQTPSKRMRSRAYKKTLRQRSGTKLKPHSSRRTKRDYHVVYQMLSLLPTISNLTQGEEISMEIGVVEVMESSDMDIHPFLIVIKYTGLARSHVEK